MTPEQLEPTVEDDGLVTRHADGEFFDYTDAEEQFDPTFFTHWPTEIEYMHDHYGHRAVVDTFTPAQLLELLKFRIKFAEEELSELKKAVEDPEGTAEDVVDALIDKCVVDIGTLDLFGVDAQKAWDVVLNANMAKETGINPSRPNPLGLPDLIKPPGWTAPDHSDNVGRLKEIFE